MGELVLYSSDESEEEEIVADLDAGYDIMYDKLGEDFESEDELKAELCRVIEATIFQEIQAASDDPELHKAIVDLMGSLKDTGEIDIDSLTQNSVHQLMQLRNQ